MQFELFEQGKELLRNEDNSEWIDKITCWVKRELGYNIYVFQVVVNDQKEIEINYETITAAIAVDFQSTLKKAIEKWNIYLVFECRERVDWKLKLKVEKDKFAVRKVVWDDLKEKEINNKDYINKRLLCFEVKGNIENTNTNRDLIQIIKENDIELYKILQKKKLSIVEKAAMYIGEGLDE